MVGGENQHVIVFEPRDNVGEDVVKVFETLCKAARIIAVPVQHVEIFEVSKDELSVGFHCELKRDSVFNIVLGSFYGSESSFAEEFGYDPDSVYVLNGVNKVCGREEGIIFSTLGSLEPSISGSDKRSCNHALDVVRSDA